MNDSLESALAETGELKNLDLGIVRTHLETETWTMARMITQVKALDQTVVGTASTLLLNSRWLGF
jgi:hypothetical protein